MKILYSLLTFIYLLTFFASTATAQNCNDCRYISHQFDSVTIETVHFGRGVKIDGDTQELYMDIYQPYGDTVTERPVVMFAFGGAFVQGSKNDWYVKEVCNHFSKAGYVCAAMDYRTGIDYLEILQLQHMRIFFRPMQDYRGAVQYLKWDFSENGNTYRIDTNMIFAGGASSGGITALMMQNCDKPNEMAEMGNISALNALGGFYSSTGFYQNYGWNVAATINIAGALINANWIEQGDDPIISAHGDADQVVPYGYGPLGGGLLGGFFDLQGSYVVDSIARTKGVCSYLYTMEGRDHPSESMGVEYFYSIVYRIMLRMNAVRNNLSFCCPLKVDITPGDTLYYSAGQQAPPATLTANVVGDNGNAALQWCTMPCQFSSTSSSITVTPDTTLKYIAAIATESNCSAGDLYIVYDSTGLWSSFNSASQQPIQFCVSPQPTNQFLQLVWSDEFRMAKSAKAEMFDLLGKKVLDTTTQFSNSFELLDVSHLSAGSYFLRLSVGHKQASKLVVISR